MTNSNRIGNKLNDLLSRSNYKTPDFLTWIDRSKTQDLEQFKGEIRELVKPIPNERKIRYTGYRGAKCADLLTVYIPYNVFYRRGGNLNEASVTNFNIFLEDEIKHKFHTIMDVYIDILPSFEQNLPAVRRYLGIDIEDWSDDSMKKDYYRYRLRSGRPLLYNTNSEANVTAYRDSQFDPCFG